MTGQTLMRLLFRSPFRSLLLPLALAALLFAGQRWAVPAAGVPGAQSGSGQSWQVTQNGTILQIAYGSGADFPQYGALDLNSGYFRSNYGPGSGWGASIILLPVFWSSASCPPPGLCQGAPITASPQVVGSDLVLTINGTIGGLMVATTVDLSPPGNDQIAAQVATSLTGTVTLDKRPWEAFKPVMVSTMHISASQWDARQALIGYRPLGFPAGQWIMSPPALTRWFGIVGGTSAWKTNAPTIIIMAQQALQVTGWVTPSTNPNDDNVGIWDDSDTVVPAYSYRILATMPTGLMLA